MFTNLQTKNTRFLKLANKNKAAYSSRALESFLYLVCSAVADDLSLPRENLVIAQPWSLRLRSERSL